MRRAGAVLMVGVPGADLDRSTAEHLARIEPAGVILFRRNLDTPDRLQHLLDALDAVAGRIPWVAIDQEGGRVSRLEAWIGPTPTAAQLSALDREHSRRLGESMGRVLEALGINLDFAPVVDLCDSSAANGIGDRSFGQDPALVIDRAGAFLDGLQSAGVAGCLKHFPGLGSTIVDSHLLLPRVERNAGDIERCDLAPFRALAPRAATVMVAHGHFPALDRGPVVPSSASRGIVHGILRERLGFGGLVVGDDLEMGAVAALDRDGGFAVQAIAAGCDLLLYCSDLQRAERGAAALVAAAEHDAAFAARLDEAGAKVAAVAARWRRTATRAASIDDALLAFERLRREEFA